MVGRSVRIIEGVSRGHYGVIIAQNRDDDTVTVRIKSHDHSTEVTLQTTDVKAID